MSGTRIRYAVLNEPACMHGGCSEEYLPLASGSSRNATPGRPVELPVLYLFVHGFASDIANWYLPGRATST